MTRIIEENKSFKSYIYLVLDLDGFAVSLYVTDLHEETTFLNSFNQGKLILSKIVESIKKLICEYSLAENNFQSLNIYIHSDNQKLNSKLDDAISKAITLDKLYVEYNDEEEIIDEQELKSSHKLFANYIDEDLIKTNRDLDRQKLIEARRSRKYESLTLHAMIRGAIHARGEEKSKGFYYTSVEVDSGLNNRIYDDGYYYSNLSTYY